MTLWTTRLLLLGAAATVVMACAVLACAAAQQEEPRAKVREGQPAPEVELPATQIDKVLPDKKDAKTLRLKELQGKKHVVLYFFPKAATKG
jgi:hypothetical protein